MNKGLKIILIILTVIIFGVGSYFLYNYLIKKKTQKPTNATKTQSFLWGTEGNIYILNYSDIPDKVKKKVNIINNTLRVKYVKIRLQLPMASKDGKTFTSLICFPSQLICYDKYNLDEIVKLFKENNWSMIPMLSYYPENVTQEEIENYANFVYWFVSRYKKDADIKYIELINCPVLDWRGTKEQLLEANNKAYERIKSQYPDVMVGTPGFEYWLDRSDKAEEEIEYFLEKNNGAKFDFWAFHGYASTGSIGSKSFYPPTKTAKNNKYAGVKGILEIRKKLDENGWQNRLIIDTEHTGIVPPKPTILEKEDMVDAAYMVQELLLKRTLMKDGKLSLSGIIPLKIIERGDKGEFLWGSLYTNVSETYAVKAVGLLLSEIDKFEYSSHVSGEFDNERTSWIEKFTAINKELYIFFKPFRYVEGKNLCLDNEVLNYTLNLKEKPSSVRLTDIYGNKKALPVSQKLILEVINQPKFLEIVYEN